ncbi:hypothetical protein LZ32DRAFT_603990 [Colletotrichum eremochloae]|nr:hypothetical protein LZ32DRAFT_603990 [Colletotrichum eremochloae]
MDGLDQTDLVPPSSLPPKSYQPIAPHLLPSCLPACLPQILASSEQETVDIRSLL